MTTQALNWPIALQLARANGHLPGPRRDNGVMAWAECQRCRAALVERLDDGKGVTGGMTETKCRR